MINVPHVPVMLDAVCNHLLIERDGVYLDGTVGFGGHSSEILKYLDKNGRLIGLDLDPYALEYSNKHLSVHLNLFSLYHASYKDFPEVIDSLGIKKLNGMLFDLGTSSYQVDSSHRGFSYMKDSDLDMRFNNSKGLTAKEFLNSVEERELADIIYINSQEKRSRQIASSIINMAKNGNMLTTFDLKHAIEKKVDKRYLVKSLSRVFQAIRIHVNNELDSLKKLLSFVFDYLDVDGRLIFITFHSIEDRIVKSFFKKNSICCICPKELPVCVCSIKPKIEIVTRKALLPSKEEIKINSRSRSAKMRVARGL